jgi:hypothetical protein
MEFSLVDPVQAADSYNCVIENVVSQSLPIGTDSDPSENTVYLTGRGGSMLGNWSASSGQNKADALSKPLLGQTFVVDKRSGEISGTLVSIGHMQTSVLDYGNEMWSYQESIIGLPDLSGHRHVDYFQVKQYAKTERKPFIYVHSIFGILMGDCTELH